MCCIRLSFLANTILAREMRFSLNTIIHNGFYDTYFITLLNCGDKSTILIVNNVWHSDWLIQYTVHTCFIKYRIRLKLLTWCK